MSELTQKKLKQNFHYNKSTGALIRTIPTGRHGCHKKGVEVGFKDKDGRIYVRFNKRLYLIHRLIWLYMYGYFPENDIDHINRNPSDNRILNLREVSHQCNLRNTGNRSDNTSSIKGVGLRGDTKKWSASIHIFGKKFSGGSYKNFHNAVCARLALEQCFNWSGCDSSSPAFQYVQKMLGRQ